MSLNDALEGGIDTDRRMRTIQTQPDGSAKRTALAEPESGGLHTRGIFFVFLFCFMPDDCRSTSNRALNVLRNAPAGSRITVALTLRATDQGYPVK